MPLRNLYLRTILLLLLSAFTKSSIAQMAALEDLIFAQRQLTFAASNDSLRITSNDSVSALFDRAAKEATFFDYNFEKLSSISILKSADKKVKLITWNVQLADFTEIFNGLIVYKNKKNTTVYKLKPSTKLNTDWENIVSDSNNWFGAVYYDILPVKAGNKNTYTVLGWHGVNRIISQKVIEFIELDETSIYFGGNHIKHGSSIKKRAVFSYPNELKFTLNYQADEKRIVFDRLLPIEQKFAGNYAFYTSQFIFDAYVFKGGRWNLEQDVRLTMPERALPILTIEKGLLPAKKP